MISTHPLFFSLPLVSQLMVFMHRDEDETKFNIGQITSLAVFRTYRRLGLAEKLMRQSRIELCVSS